MVKLIVHQLLAVVVNKLIVHQLLAVVVNKLIMHQLLRVVVTLGWANEGLPYWA